MTSFFKTQSNPARKLAIALIATLIAALLVIVVLEYGVPVLNQKKAETAEKTTADFAQFSEETYKRVKEQYWNKISDDELSELFRRAAEKATGNPQILQSKDAVGVTGLIKTILAGKDTDSQKREIVINIIQIVLYNLPPTGRNALLSQKEERTLRETVSNIDRSRDLYATVGVSKSAPQEEIDKAYEGKKQELAKEKTPEAEEKLKELSYAYTVLSDENAKERYNEAGVEPTVFQQIVSPAVLYFFVSKISPSTFDELISAANAHADDKKLSWLILDIRGNVGGATDLLQYILGLFIGENAYGYDFYRQDNYTPFKTRVQKLPSLERFRRRIVLLTDTATQSSAEILTATFKKYNVALVVGEPTRGWGTIENTFPLSATLDPAERYSLLLTHSITLRDDGQPIEGRGVDPDIDIKTTSWKEELKTMFASPTLAETVINVLKNPPLK